MDRRLTLEFWIDDGWHVGQLRELPGVMSQGETLPDLIENIRDAYRMMEPETAASQGEIALCFYRKASGSGKKFDDIGHLAIPAEDPGFSLHDIKAWRDRELAAGRPSRLDDYFSAHGICSACRCYGLQMTGWDEDAQAPLWSVCSACGGTGRTL
jgi:predicted RNase H-like HicB family nuclease